MFTVILMLFELVFRLYKKPSCGNTSEYVMFKSKLSYNIEEESVWGINF